MPSFPARKIIPHLPRWLTPLPLRDVLALFVRARHWEPRLEQERAVALWESTVGPPFDTQSAAMSVRNGTLLVHVSDHTWANRLTFLKSSFIYKLRERGVPSLRNIHIRVAPLPFSIIPPPATPDNFSPLPPLPPPTSLPDAFCRLQAAALRRQARLAPPSSTTSPESHTP